MANKKALPFFVIFILPLYVLLALVLAKPSFATASGTAPGPGEKWLTAELLFVFDGDSFQAKIDGSFISIRLWGIDAPESDQAHANRSRHHLRHLLDEKPLMVKGKAIDRYGRLVALVKVDTITINHEMIRTGNAWVHRFYCQDIVCKSWYITEEQARRNKRGLWSSPNPVPPWVWKSKK